MKNKILLLLTIFAVSSLNAQTPNNCGNYTTTGSVLISGYTDPNPACGSNVPGTVGSGPAYWDGAGCSGQLISTVVGPAVSCLTLAYTAVNTDDYATITTNTGGALTITAVNCGVSGNVIGPYNCGTGYYGTCGITVCSTVPFTQVILSNTGCSSGWVIDCGTPTVSCTNPVITPEADLIFCAGATVPVNTFSSTPAGTFTWTNSNPSIGLAGSGSGNVPSFVATNATTAPITANITVTATNGACTGTDVYTITVNPQPTTNANIDQTVCAGGTITLAGTIGGGASSGTWSAPSGTFSNVNSLTSTYTPTITTGTVTLTLTTDDPAGPCVAASDQMVVTVTPGATANANIDQTVCAGGTITLAGSIGGTATSSTWSAPSGTFSNASSLTSTYTPTITTGTVTLTLTTNDPAGPCPAATDVMVVTVTPLPAFTVTGADPTTCGGSDGTITLSGLTASTNYLVTYNDGGIVGPTTMMSDGGGNITIGGLSSGTYSGFSLELNTCVGTSPTVVVLADPSAPVVNAGVDETVCEGTSVTLTANNPDGAIITWNNGVTDGTPFTPAVGTLTYVVTADLMGCISTDQVDVTVNPVPTVNDPANQVLCTNSATAPVNFSGGLPGTVYDWTNDNTTIGLGANGSGNIPSFTALSPGTTVTANLTVTPNLSGCVGATQSFTIMVIQSTPSLTCPGNLTATCSITEQPPYASFAAFTGAGGSASSIGSVIVPATFTLDSEVSDGLSCPETVTRTYSIEDTCGNIATCTQTIVVDDNINPTATAPATVIVQCIADVPAPAPASITDEADNCGVPAVAFISDVSDGNTCPETITRTYAVTDACGNSITLTQTIVVDDNTNPTASNPAAINVNCASAVPAPDPAVVTTEADNCTTNPVVAFVSDVSDGNVCNNETITRTYSVTDNCGNSINVTQQIVIGVTTPTILAGADQSVCEGTLVTLTAGNPDGAAITWDNGVINGTPFNAPVGTTTYTVTAVQCGGECVSTDQVDVTVSPLPVVAFAADVLLGCDPLTVNFTNLTVPAGANCAWNFGNGVTGSGCATTTYTYLDADIYDVSLTVTSLAGCTSTATYANYITVVNTPVAAFTGTPTIVPLENTEVDFENESLYADSYSWDFGDNTSATTIHPSHTYPLVGNMDYLVELIATNYLGCDDTAWLQVTVEDEILFYVPNIFTPDDDDINNTFFPVFTAGFDPYEYHLTIFNRWGEVLFESYNATTGWTGTYGNQGLVEDGVYIWQIEFGETMSDKRHTHRGHVTVLK